MFCCCQAHQPKWEGAWTGFYNQLDELFKEIEEDIKMLCSAKGVDPQDVQRIYVTGHSLGGALATLGKPEPPLATLGKPEPRLATLGKPEPALATLGKPEPPLATLVKPEPPLATLGKPEPPLATLGKPERPLEGLVSLSLLFIQLQRVDGKGLYDLYGVCEKTASWGN